MKLYTEEQVRKAIDMARDRDMEYTKYGIFDELTPIELPSDEEIAILFHNKYEELAPKFGYETRKETKEFKKDSNNGKLMIAVCTEILQILNQNN